MINDALTIFHALKKRLDTGKIDPWVAFEIGQDFAYDVEYLLEHLGLKAQYETLMSVYNGLQITDKKDLKVTGHDLMTLTTEKPGKWMSVALDDALKAVVYKELNNDKNDIIEWIQEKKLIPGFNENS